MSEKQRIESVYTKYESDAAWQDRYSIFNPEVLAERQNLERAQLDILRRCGFARRMGDVKLLDIGAGTGSFGLRPSRGALHRRTSHSTKSSRRVLSAPARTCPKA